MQQCRTVITPGRLQRGWIGEEHVFNLTSFQTSTSATSTHSTVKSHQLQPTNLKSHTRIEFACVALCRYSDTHPASSVLMFLYTSTMLLLCHVRSSEVQCEKASTSCSASLGSRQGLPR